jgi:small subunit ribosomal protein S18
MKRMQTKRKPREEMLLKKQSRHLDGVRNIESQDYDLLRRFVTEHGKIIPSRLTGACAKQQRQIKRGVRRARQMGLMA